MNERIRELWSQCVIKHTKTPMNWQDAADEFAELIVQECLEQVRDEVQYEYDWKLADAVTKRVLEHFGVE